MRPRQEILEDIANAVRSRAASNNFLAQLFTELDATDKISASELLEWLEGANVVGVSSPGAVLQSVIIKVREMQKANSDAG